MKKQIALGIFVSLILTAPFSNSNAKEIKCKDRIMFLKTVAEGMIAASKLVAIEETVNLYGHTPSEEEQAGLKSANEKLDFMKKKFEEIQAGAINACVDAL